MFGEQSGAGCLAALPEPPEPRHVSACAVDVKCAVNLTELLFHALTYPLPSYQALSLTDLGWFLRLTIFNVSLIDVTVSVLQQTCALLELP